MHNPETLFDIVTGLTPESIIDVGCGDGKLIKMCEQHGIKAFGVEVDEAKRKYLSLKGVKTFTGSAEGICVECKSADLVILERVLHHLERPEIAIQEASRVAKKRVIVSENYFPTGFELERYSDRLSKAIHRASGAFHADPILATEVNDLAHMCEMTVVNTYELERHTNPTSLKTVNETWLYHDRFLKHLSKDDVLVSASKSLKEKYGERLLKTPPSLVVELKSQGL